MTLLVQRSTATITVSFHSIEFSSSHWAASLALPPRVRFQLVHRQTGGVVHTADAGPTNSIAVPPAFMYVG